jgi:hypothetical protein
MNNRQIAVELPVVFKQVPLEILRDLVVFMTVFISGIFTPPDERSECALGCM